MRKIKLYKYPSAPGHVHDAIPEYRDSVPFSEDGIERWCELVDAKDAELFYCGQYNDQNAWMLSPNRFEHFYGANQSLHVFDLEGDHSEKLFHPWMEFSIITAMNAEPNHANWNCMVRPGCSMLLMDMLKNPRWYIKPKNAGFFFMGQRDPCGLRERLKGAFLSSQADGVYLFTDKWNAVSSLDDKDVIEYEQGMRTWSFALCPAGTGQMSVRYYEALGFGRMPIVVANNLPIMNDWHGYQISSDASQEQLRRWLEHIQNISADTIKSYVDDGYRYGLEFFWRWVKTYFDDPTLFFLAWAHKRGIINYPEAFSTVWDAQQRNVEEFRDRNNKRIEGAITLAMKGENWGIVE